MAEPRPLPRDPDKATPRIEPKGYGLAEPTAGGPTVIRDPKHVSEVSREERSRVLFDDLPDPERAVELDAEGAPAVRKTFAEHRRDTPAAPLSGGLKALLYTVGLLVGLLFAATLYKVTNRPRRPPATPPPGATTGAGDVRGSRFAVRSGEVARGG